MVEPGASIVVELPCSSSRKGAIPGLAKPALSYPSHPEMKMTTGPAETGPTVSQFPDDRRLPVVWCLVVTEPNGFGETPGWAKEFAQDGGVFLKEHSVESMKSLRYSAY